MPRPREKAEETHVDLRSLPSNVVPFPRVRRAIPAAAPALQQRKRTAAIASAQLNARLLVLLAICTMGATSALLAIHILHS